MGKNAEKIGKKIGKMVIILKYLKQEESFQNDIIPGLMNFMFYVNANFIFPPFLPFGLLFKNYKH